MKKVVSALFFVFLINNAKAEIKNINSLLDCSHKRSRVEAILKEDEQFAQKIAKVVNIFHKLETYIDLEVEKNNILDPLIKLDKALFHPHLTGDEFTSLDDVLACFSTINYSVDKLMLKIMNNPGLDHDFYNGFFIDLKNMLNVMEVPLRDLVENHSKKCSTRSVLDAAGRSFIEDKKLDSTVKDPLEESIFRRTVKNLSGSIKQ